MRERHHPLAFNYQAFATLLKASVEGSGLTAVKAAREMGISNATLHNALSRRSTPDLESYTRMKAWMRLPEWLWTTPGIPDIPGFKLAAPRPPIPPPLAYARDLVELHVLCSQGLNESPESEHIRDAMKEDAFTLAQQQAIQDISALLATLYTEPKP